MGKILKKVKPKSLIKLSKNPNKFWKNIDTIGDSAFEYLDIKEIIIPEGITSIGDYAFADCNNLEKIVLPSTLTHIGYSCFLNCSNLKEINIPNSVTEIKDRTFVNTGIETLVIPEGVQWIETYAFSGCEKLKKLVLPSSLEQPRNEIDLTTCTALEELELSLTSFYPKIIFENKEFTLKKLIINDKSTHILKEALEGLPSVESLYITVPTKNNPQMDLSPLRGVKHVHINSNILSTFQNLANSFGRRGVETTKSIETIEVIEGSTILRTGIFSNLPNLREISLPSTIKSISIGEICDYCHNLKKISFYSDCMETKINRLFNTSTKNLDANGTGSSIEEIIIKEGSTTINEELFANMTHLKKVSLPSTLTTIKKYAFNNCNHLEEIDIPDSVTNLEDSCFTGCTSLTKAKLPTHITYIPHGLFFKCTQLKDVIIGDEIDSIGSQAFSHCQNLKHINLSNSITFIGNSCFYNCSSLEYIEFPNNVTLSPSILMGCKNLKKVKLPTNIKEIPEEFFYGCINLENFDIPDGVTTLNKRSFYKCSGLKHIELNKKLNTISTECFAFCSSLKNIDIPANVTHIGHSCFKECENLESISIPENITFLNDRTFYKCNKLSHIELPSTLEYIGKETFAECNSIHKLTLPEGLIEIDDRAFSQCSYLEHINFPSTLKYINEEAFKDSCIKTAILPESLERLRHSAFDGCTNLEEVYIPNKIKSLHAETFKDCVCLKKITLPEGLEKIGTSVFNNCRSLENLTLPDSLTEIESSAFQHCDSIKEFHIPDSVTKLGDYCFNRCNNLETVTLSSSLTKIPGRAFNECQKLKHVTLPKKLLEIEDMAFYSASSLEHIELPESLVSISDEAFEFCTNLKDITIPKNVNKLGMSSFKNCTSLEKVIINGELENLAASNFENCTNLNEIMLPNTLKFIGKSSFKRCTSLTEIKIPSNVEYIDSSAFDESNIAYVALNKNNEICYISKKQAEKDAYPHKIELHKINEVLQNFNAIRLFNNKDKTPILFEKIIQLHSMGISLPSSTIETDEELEKMLLNTNYKIFKNVLKLIPDNYKKTSLSEIFNLAKAMGIFESDNRIIKYNGKELPVNMIGYTALQGAFKQGTITFEQLHSRFSTLHTKEFNEEFFLFMINKNNLVDLKEMEEKSSGFTSRVYGWYQERKSLDLNSTNNYDMRIPSVEEHRYCIEITEPNEEGVYKSHWRKPTVKLFEHEFKNKLYNNINTPRKHEIAEVLAKYNNDQKQFDKAIEIDEERVASGVPDHLTKKVIKEDILDAIEEYKQRTQKLKTDIEDETSEILHNQTDTASKIFTYEMIAKSDPRNFVIGYLTDCCARLYGPGAGAQRAMIIHPDMQPLVIKDIGGNIIAFSILYINREEGYLVANDIEVSMKYDNNDEASEEIVTKTKQGIKAFIEQYNLENPEKPIKIATTGISPRLNARVSKFLKQEKMHSTTLKAPNFEDYKYVGSGHWNGDWHGDQYVLWEMEKNLTK